MQATSWALGGAMLSAALVAASCSASGGPAGGTGAGSATGGSSAGGTGGTFGAGGTAGTVGNDAGPLGDAGYEPGETITVIGPGANGSTPGEFAGADDASRAPTVLYPADGIVVPPNLNALEVHFRPASGQTVFEITWESTSVRLREYVGCAAQGGGCVHTPDRQLWERIVESAKGGHAVRWSVRGAGGGGSPGASPWRGIWVAKEAITGGIYYWNTNGAIQRYDFGYPLQQAENFLRPPQVGATFCIGCHALSRDGALISFGLDLPGVSPYKVYDVATRTQLQANGQPVGGAGMSFYSFSPDGSEVLIANGIRIQKRNIATGQITPVIAAGTHPDWSPDGQRIVYARQQVTPPIATASCGSAQIELATLQPDGTWAQKVIVPFQGQNSYYPTFSPLQEWVLFNRSPGNRDSFSNASPTDEAGTPDGELWVVRQDGGPILRLDAASDGSWATWPKWTPGLYTYAGNRTVMFFTFSSGREYGLRFPANQRVQLWMTGFDPDRAAEGVDPSFPPYWFPYQAQQGGNHIAQWVTTVQRKPCSVATDCLGNESCSGGKCVPVVQ